MVPFFNGMATETGTGREGHDALTKPLQAAADVVDVRHISLPEAQVVV